ncbi:Predicted phospholipase, patatin/cPLA2 family [Tistlia consotensis]|uniref:Predicted phospholipase, patatin/cPLA2 family n=1 Tax=Tistlia consotensis USBA 355 TaxID=560819 RepID=A0A1Y6BVE4_9PROT|nr:patatin-like phospholipase family protein [Tistlia consotensis]SMF29812.1 Predicted phospholipase, patatin/cPLA2 family [Tistlia consotensis USBA 355]SNR90802.1 Predicted phospholipase, patatin/cPLA2 family [Tistlia consotensis]
MSRRLLEILRARRAAGGGPPFDDPHLVALVAEGGAMRGVIAGGMVTALEEAGFADCFDLMVGTSAGACALAYLRAGQARLGTSIYFEDINNRSFIDTRRPLRGRAIVDIDFLVDRVFREVKPLDHRRLASPGPRLLAVATDVDRGEGVALEGFENRERAYEVLRATTRMPLLAAGPVEIDGRRYIDGSAADRIPIAYAQRLGATHVLVILTRSPNSRSVTQPSAIRNYLKSNLFAALYHRNLRTLTRHEANNYSRIYQILTDYDGYEIGGVRCRAVSPAGNFREISRIETNEEVLRGAAQHGQDRMNDFLMGTNEGSQDV